jgi:hypothetical protein
MGEVTHFSVEEQEGEHTEEKTHGLHLDPPQSTLISSPFKIPSLQVAGGIVVGIEGGAGVVAPLAGVILISAQPQNLSPLVVSMVVAASFCQLLRVCQYMCKMQ